jgi:hypothetical protein
MASTPTVENSSGISLRDVARIVAVVGLLGAAILHFAYAPGHLDAETSHGIFFLTVGWLQLLLAATLVLRARPERLWLGVTAAVNLAIIGVWVVSRTVGVPGSESESVSLPDVTATVLEAIVVLSTVAMLANVFNGRTVTGNATLGLGGVSALATVVVVSMAVTPSFAGDHGAGGHDHGSDGDSAAHADMEGMDHGHPAAGDPTAAEDWAQIRFDALAGYTSEAQIEQF